MHAQSDCVGDIQRVAPSSRRFVVDQTFPPPNEANPGIAQPTVTYEHPIGRGARVRGYRDILSAPPGIEALLIDVPHQALTGTDELECDALARGRI